MDDSEKLSGKREDKIPAAAAAAGSVVKVPKKKGRKVKPKGFPKRPLSAYNWFFKEERQKVLNLDFQSMGKEVSARWKKTTPEQRKPFDVLAKQDAQRYKKEVQIYEEEQILKARKEREQAKQNAAASAPPQEEGLTAAAHLRMPPNELSAMMGNTALGTAFDNRANALLAAAAVRAMEEKNHPDAPQRLSPRLAPMIPPSAATNLSSFSNLSALEMARQQHQQQQQQQLNQMLLANEMQNMQYQAALQSQLSLGMFPQGAAAASNAMGGGQAGAAFLLEQLRRQEQQSLLNDYLLLQQQQQGQQSAMNVLSAAGLNSLSSQGGGGGLGSNVADFSSMMGAGAQNPLLQRAALGERSSSLEQTSNTRSASAAATGAAASLQNAAAAAGLMDQEALIRSLTARPPKREGSK
ncbi:MAG: hypothetical protein SGILL_009099 [Bacillariaceae sp.]